MAKEAGFTLNLLGIIPQYTLLIAMSGPIRDMKAGFYTTIHQE